MSGTRPNGEQPKSQADLPIAVDTAGGDRGIDVQVEGAVLAYKEYGCRSILVGPQELLESRLDLLGAKAYPISVQHAPQTIGMDESPTRAVRRKPQSSLCVAYNLVQSGRASSVISSGNSGAMMAAGRIICGLLPGIERPAIATLIPVAGDGLPNVVMDSGANVECHAHHLVQFAVMGAIYFDSLFNTGKARVALLSNGSEPSKGTDVIRAASQVLSQMENIDFVGYVEGRDVPANAANVIVCDGFVGNVLLKGMEGCVRLIFEQLMHESKKSLLGKMALLLSRDIYRRVFQEKFDYTAYGGAPLLGLRKLAIVLHGSSDARAVKNAIRVAQGFSTTRMTEKISQELTQLEDSLLGLDDDVFVGVLAKGKLMENGKRGAKPADDDDVSDSADADDA